MLKRRIIISLLAIIAITSLKAQIGVHRNDLSIGVSGGYVLSNVGFNPKVPQNMHKGITGGITVRYVCEKYFNSICAIQAELNYARLGWDEKIWDLNDNQIINSQTGLAEKYTRTLNYIQLPIFARMGWGRENRGIQFFFQAGPQLGYFLSETTETNFNISNYNMTTQERSSSIVAQDTMNIKNKLDYGIVGGLGIEYSIPKVGHFILEGRYYYGLGDLFGNSKRDYFGRSNLSNIVIKMTYLFDLTKTKY